MGGGRVSGTLFRDGTVPRDIGRERAVAHGLGRVQCGDGTGKIVQEQLRHALVEEDLDGPWVAGRERAELAVCYQVITAAIRV